MTLGRAKLSKIVTMLGLCSLFVLGMQVRVGWTQEPCTVDSCETDDGIAVRIINYGSSVPAAAEGPAEEYAENRRVEISGRLSARFPVGGTMWITEDPSSLEPRLAVKTSDRVRIVDGRIAEPVKFGIYLNYPAFVEGVEIAIHRSGDVDRVAPLAVLNRSLSQSGSTLFELSWDGAIESDQQLVRGEELFYYARARGRNGQFDETAPSYFTLVSDADVLLESSFEAGGNNPNVLTNLPQGSMSQVFGQNALSQQNILIYGSRVRISGEDLPEDSQLRIRGEQIPISLRERFAVEYLLPVGTHAFPIELIGPDGQIVTRSLTIDVTGDYLFMVGLADLTVGSNDISGSMEPLAGDDRYDEDVLVEGRAAFYLKGKIQGKYLLTAQLDSQEEELDDLLGNLSLKNPRSLFRRLDPDRYYPVYGDDSTTWRDTNSQGRLYVRLDWDKSQLLWGNFNTSMTNVDLAQYNRSLYGVMLNHATAATTELGQARTDGRVFYSEPQSALGHNEFLGTGGSLYYLRNTDIVLGSDKVFIEIRARDSERLIERIPLQRGADYDIDELQGRIILSRPLLQISNQLSPRLIKDNAIDGNNVHLVVDYEYIPSAFDADHASVGGTVRHWLGEHLALGATYVEENRDGGEYVLNGLEFILQADRGTYLKFEQADSEDSAVTRYTSNNGGIDFTQSLLTGLPSAPLSGTARIVEGRFNLQERGWTDREWTGGLWWRDREAGFSSARFGGTGTDVNEYGFEFFGQATDRLRLTGRYAVAEQSAGLSALLPAPDQRRERASLQMDWRLTDQSLLSGELQRQSGNDPVLSASPLAPGDIDATIAALQYKRTFNDRLEGYVRGQFALDTDDSRYKDNDLATIGIRHRVGQRTSVGAEYSDGDRGSGAVAVVDHWLNDAHQVYGSYTLSTDSTTDALGMPMAGSEYFGRGNNLTFGHRSRISNQVSIFNESQVADQSTRAGIVHVFGLNLTPDPGWSLGFSYQYSDVETELEPLRRDAATLSGGFISQRTNWRSTLEYRRDLGLNGEVRQRLTANQLSRKITDSLRVMARLNYARTEGAVLLTEDAEFTEATIGLAYRPIADDRLNLISKLTHLYDLGAESQDNPGTDQRSNIMTVEAIYRLSSRWELGGKLGWRRGELRTDRNAGMWFESETDFAAVRVRYHMIRRWDSIAEYRQLSVNETNAKRAGFLLGIDRHLGEHFKVGIGYNFTDFSDDLTDLDYDHEGWFLNIVGKY